MQVRKITLPYMPERLQEKLMDNGKFQSEAEIARIKSLIPGTGKYGKKKLNSAFPWVVIDARFFILCSKGYWPEGAFGKVVPAQDAQTGELIAFKIMKCQLPQEGIQTAESVDDPALIFATQHEASFLAAVGLAITNQQGVPLQLSYQSNHPNRKKYLIAMQWLRGQTLSHLHEFPFIVTLHVIQQMLKEVKRIHTLGMLHRDIKRDNFMFDDDSHRVTLIDFGLARTMSKEKTFQDVTEAGTEKYIAPEIINPFDNSNFLEVKRRFSRLEAIRQNLLALKSPTPEALHALLNKFYIYNEQTEIYALGVTIKALGCNKELVPCALQEKLKAQYKLMKHKEPSTRPTIDSCLHFFSTLEQALPDKERHFRVGLIDINEVSQLRKRNPDDDYMNSLSYQIIEALQSAHRIILVDSGNSPDLNLYATVFNDLSRCGLNLAREIYCAPFSNPLLATILTDLRAKHPLYRIKLYYIELDKTTALTLQNEQPIMRLAHRFTLFKLKTLQEAQDAQNQSLSYEVAAPRID